jgi:hypothetical protein
MKGEISLLEISLLKELRIDLELGAINISPLAERKRGGLDSSPLTDLKLTVCFSKR